MTRTFTACYQEVANRGVAPDDFLNEVIDWCRNAPDEIFERNNNNDVYSLVVDELGPFSSLLYRKAVMLEVLRVLGGFESSWNWEEGPDPTNPNSNMPCTEEAGIFQCSGDSMGFDRSLRDYVISVVGSTDCNDFQSTTKENHRFAIEYCERLLRFTTDHHGPLLRREVNAWLSTAAVQEFLSFIA